MPIDITLLKADPLLAITIIGGSAFVLILTILISFQIVLLLVKK